MQQPKIAALTLLATALLAACGGGDTAAPTLSASVASAPREQAQAVTPEDAARQLLDFAEGSVFKTYFPGHPDTQTFGPFRFRYYPTTGVYLGVVVAADATYGPVGAVYVMGGSFGAAPTKVGMLTDFITPIDSSGGGGGGGGTTGANNGCFDLATMDTPGTRLIVDYRYSGPSTGSGTWDWSVVGLTTFEGNSAYETLFKTTTVVTSPRPLTTTVEVRNYARRTGDAEVTHYGNSSSVAAEYSGYAATTTTKEVYTPPWVSKLAGIPLGGTLTETWTEISTSSTVVTGIPIPVPPTTSTSTTTTTSTYAANETLTVPAGTYSTCRYESTVAGTPAGASVTTWYVRGKGMLVKSLTRLPGSVDSVLEATSITLNGSRL